MRISVFTQFQNPARGVAISNVSKTKAKKLLDERQDGQPLYVAIVDRRGNLWAIQVVQFAERDQPIPAQLVIVQGECTRIPETPANRYPREFAQRRDGFNGYSWEQRSARRAGH
jgi:hypothetical protein